MKLIEVKCDGPFNPSSAPVTIDVEESQYFYLYEKQMIYLGPLFSCNQSLWLLLFRAAGSLSFLYSTGADPGAGGHGPQTAVFSIGNNSF